jgi:tripartite-type tricarboxylate transporter receptor subunit TctC
MTGQNKVSTLFNLRVVRRLHATALMLITAALLGSQSGAIADEWPSRPVTVIVPYAAGGNSDIMARLLADGLSKQLKQSFIVENRGGVGGAAGTEYVARAAKDGYTLLCATTAQFSIVPLVQTVRYDPATSFEPVSLFGSNANIIAISDKVPATSLKEFIAYAKANPGKLNYGSGGVGTVTHLAGAFFASKAGLDIIHVPFRGGSQMVAELSAGHIEVYVGSTSELLSMGNGAGIKLLAVTSPKRLASAPDLPAVAELVPGYEIGTWNGLLAPTGVPKEIIAQLERAAIAAAKDPETQEKLAKLGIEARGTTSEEFRKVIADEAAVYREVVAAAGLTKQ